MACVISTKAAADAGLIKRPAKTSAKRFERDGHKWESESEYGRWLVLRDMERQGEIRSLKVKSCHEFRLNGIFIGTYTDDFQYERQESGKWASVVEDWKGYAFRDFWRQMRLMLAFHGIRVLITSTHGEWRFRTPSEGKRPEWLRAKKSKGRCRK